MVKRKPRRKIFLINLCSLLLALLIVSAIFFVTRYFLVLKSVLSTNDFVMMQVDDVVFSGEGAVVFMKGNCSEFSFVVSSQQGEAIRSGLAKEIGYRPLTSDILHSIMRRFGIKPVVLKVTRIQDNTYFAELTVRKGFKFLTLDARPSDGVAIAVRTDTPIYVNESIVKLTC